MPKRDFLSLSDFSREELDALLLRAIELKEERSSNVIHNSLAGKTGILILAQNSTRTRIAFEAGMNQLGGHSIFLSNRDSQASRGEPLEDFARVVSEMADVVMTRQPEQKRIELLAKHASIPVINGMSSDLHPCQLLADMQTFIELKGSIKGRSVAFIGDGFVLHLETMFSALTESNDVRIPGERRGAERAKHEAEGVEVPETLLEQIETLVAGG